MHPESGQPHPNSDRSLASLEARLRALPSPLVPGDLQARLLSAIPTEAPRRAVVPLPVWRRWLVGAALASACLLILLAWPRRDRSNNDVAHRNHGSTHTPVAPADRNLQQDAGPSLGTFSWPLEESSPMLASTAIPAELLD